MAVLSKRLNRLSQMVTEGNRLADIGTDHGYLPIELVKNKRIPFALAMDVRKGPLSKATEHIAEAGLEDYIKVRLSDGLEKLEPGEVDTVVMAGMGGRLMTKILDRWEDLSSVKEWIFSPQSEVDLFRHYIAKRGLQIVEEDLISEEDKFYFMMKTVPGESYEMDEMSAHFGPLLLARRHPVLKQYLANEMHLILDLVDILDKSESEKAKARMDVLNKKCVLISNAIDLL